MKKHCLALMLIVGSTVQARALSEPRMEYLYDTLGQSMLCEVFASMSEYRNSDEHERLRSVWMQAGAELGFAMLQDAMPIDDPGYGRRCLVHFKLPVASNLTEFGAGMLIGAELGKIRSCLMNDAMMNGPLVTNTADGKDIRDHLSTLTEVGTNLFDERNCKFVDFEE
jgi:hypothetical protein